MKSALVFSVAFLAACATQSSSSTAPPRVVSKASDAQEKALLERVKTLAGTWEGNSPHGPSTLVFDVSSANSAVREIMFPGEDHEMTNMYHMDGDSLVLTHYCAMGNQPRMRARAGSNPNELRFEFDGVTNLRAADEAYMGSMTLKIVDADHIQEVWSHYKQGVAGEPTVFDLTRKR